MSFSGNVSSVGNTLRIEVTSNGAAVRSLVLANLAALGYGLTLQHITCITERTTLFARYATILMMVVVV